MSIPIGWNLISLEEIATVQRGKFSVRPRNDPRYYGGMTPFVQTGDVASSNGKLNSYTQTLNEEGVKVSKVFPKGTILVTIAANVGDVALTQFEVAIPDSLVAINPNNKADTEWLFQYLTTQKDVLDGMATQNAQKNINLQVLQPLQILVPPLREQCRIAEILGVWDESIDLLGKLIAAKRKLKQGLMQQLFTGKKRFKEFENSKWESYSFDGIVKLRNKKFAPKGNLESHICVELEHISQISGQLIGSINSSQQASTKNYFYAGDILFGKLRPYLKKYWLAQFNGVCSTEIWVMTPQKNVISSYLFYLVQTSEFIGIANVSSGSKMPRADWGYVSEVIFLIPHIKEQEKIAAILSAADDETSTLEKQLAAYKEQKCGLMQQLLTGRTRILGLEDGQD